MRLVDGYVSGAKGGLREVGGSAEGSDSLAPATCSGLCLFTYSKGLSCLEG